MTNDGELIKKSLGNGILFFVICIIVYHAWLPSGLLT